MIENTHATTDEKIDIRTVNYGQATEQKTKAHEFVVNVNEITAGCNLLINGEGTHPGAKRGAMALRDILLATAHAPYKIEVQKEVLIPVKRLRLPSERYGVNHKFIIDSTRCYVTVNLFPDTKQPGEVFLKIDKGHHEPNKVDGGILHGFADSWSILFSVALQYGVPLKVLVDKFKHVKFPPSGMTSSTNKDLRFADSVIDYVVRWMEMKFINSNGHAEEWGNQYVAKGSI